MKKHSSLIVFLLFVIVFAAALYGIIRLYSTGVPDQISTEQVRDILVSHELEPIDITEHVRDTYFPKAGLVKCLVAEEDDIHLEFYEFDNQNSALQVFYKEKTEIITTYMTYPKVEIDTGKFGYRLYSLDAGGYYAIAVYVKDTVVYARSGSDSGAKIDTIFRNMGYIGTGDKIDLPSWGMSAIRVFQMLLYLPFCFVARKYIWRIAHQSSGMTLQQIGRVERPRRELCEWLRENSTHPTATKLWITLYKVYLWPEFLCVALTIVACFVESLIPLTNLLGVIMPLYIFCTACIALFARRFYS